MLKRSSNARSGSRTDSTIICASDLLCILPALVVAPSVFPSHKGRSSKRRTRRGRRLNKGINLCSKCTRAKMCKFDCSPPSPIVGYYAGMKVATPPSARAPSRAAARTTPPFDPLAFLAHAGGGRTVSRYRKDSAVFAQGEPADAVFYIQKGKVKLTVVSAQGKEAVVAVLGADEFCGEGCLAGQPDRKSTRLN